MSQLLWLSSLLVLTGVSAQYALQLDKQFRNDIQEPPVLLQPFNDVLALNYIPPQALQGVYRKDNGALATVIYIVEFYNKLQNFATAFIRPFNVFSKPKPSLAPAAETVVVGAPPVARSTVPATKSIPASPKAPRRFLFLEEIPAGNVVPASYDIPKGWYLL